jgi:hypothetical protein
MTTSGPEFRRQVSDCLQPERNSEFDTRSLIRQGAKQAECFEVVAKTTSKSLL